MPPDQPADDAGSPDDASPDCYCPAGELMSLLSRRHAMPLICVVSAIGPARYGEIEAQFDRVSSSTLSTRLDELVDAGLFTRAQYAEIPPRVEYELTDTGESLARHLKPLVRWVNDLEEGTLERGST